jgi:hypothetical protein
MRERRPSQQSPKVRRDVESGSCPCISYSISIDPLLNHLGIDQTRADGVHCDAMWRFLHRHMSSQSQNSVHRSCVVGPAKRAPSLASRG